MEPTLSDLENQEPSAQEDLEKQIRGIGSDLINVRMMLRVLREQESSLMQERRVLRLTLNHLKVNRLPQPQAFDGVTEPVCPDCTEADN